MATRAWAIVARVSGQVIFRPPLRAYTRQRSELLAVLQLLPPNAWSRSATVTGAGKPLQRTVFTDAQWLVNHERSHFKHIERLTDTLRH